MMKNLFLRSREDEFIPIDDESENTIGESFINSVYEKMDKDAELKTSIFMFEKYLAMMPDTLPDDLKMSTVTNVLSSLSVTPEELVKDGKNRIKCLRNSLASAQENILSIKEKRQKEFDKLCRNLEILRNQMNEDETKSLYLSDAVSDEIKKISNIIEQIESIK